MPTLCAMGLFDIFKRDDGKGDSRKEGRSPATIMADYKRMLESKARVDGDVIAEMAGVLTTLGELEDAKRLWLDSAAAYCRDERWSWAEAGMKRGVACGLSPTDRDVLLVELEIALGRGDAAQAVQVVRKLTESLPSSDGPAILRVGEIVDTYSTAMEALELAVIDLLAIKGRPEVAADRARTAYSALQREGRGSEALRKRLQELDPVGGTEETEPFHSAVAGRPEEAGGQAPSGPSPVGDSVQDEIDQALRTLRESEMGSGVDDPETLVDLGDAFREMGLSGEAAAEYERALDDPEWGNLAREGLVRCLLQMGEVKKALERAEEGVPEQPSEAHAGLLVLQGTALDALGRDGEAEERRRIARSLKKRR